MTTPLIILGLLIAPVAILRARTAATGLPFDAKLAGTVGLSLAFVFFGVGHFAATAAMVDMLPPWVPERVLIVYLTGVLEWSLAGMLLVRRFRRAAGWMCIAVLVAFFPANVYAALNSIGMGGHQCGPIYLLIRAPLQLVLIAWTYWFVVRR